MCMVLRIIPCPGTRWFEVDRGDVLAAKQAELARLGVAFERTTIETSGPEAPAGTQQYPLKAESWSRVTADLNEVRTQGFNPGTMG
jgi:hypothetical protein